MNTQRSDRIKDLAFFPKVISATLFIIASLMMINPISAKDLECSFRKNYIKEGVVIPFYQNNSFDGIHIEILCSNNLKDQRILSLSIVNASPIEFFNAIPKKSIDFIRILETDKIMWSSEIISTKNFNNSVNFSASIIGLSENWTLENEEISEEVYIVNKENKIKTFGSAIFPSHPGVGIIVVVLFGVGIVYSIFYYDIGKRIGGWKRKRQLKKMDRAQMKARWKQMG